MIIMIFLLLFQGYSEADYVSEIIKTKDVKKIEQISNEAFKLYPKSYNLNLNTAYKYLSLKKYKKSYVLYKKAYGIYPSLDALLGLTYTQIELSKYEELLNITSKYKYNTSRSSATENEKYIFLRRSYAYLRLEKYNKSISEADKGLELYPDFKDLMLNRRYAQKMKPRISFDLIPVWGMINYSNHDSKDSYDYFGGLLYLRYGNYNFDIGYIRGNITGNGRTRTEDNFDLGLGYNKSYNIYLHLKKINLEDENLIAPYIHFGYNYDFMSILGVFSLSSYEFLDDLVYQGGIHSSFYFYDKKIIPTIALGYKYLKEDKKNSLPYVELGLNLSVNENIKVKTSFRYNQHKYFVDYLGVVDNSLDDIEWMAEAGISFNLGDFIVTPMYRYYNINLVSTDFTFGRGKAPSVSKSFFTIILGYKF